MRMSFNKGQFKTLIEETLKEVGMHSKSAVNLLLGTAAQESNFGEYIKQLYGGPALGVFQMEPATHDDIYTNFLKYKKGIWCRVDDIGGPDEECMVYNLKYATIMARLQYYRRPEPLPYHQDIPAIAAYWKQWYNTPLGKGTVEEFLENYQKYVGI